MDNAKSRPEDFIQLFEHESPDDLQTSYDVNRLDFEITNNLIHIWHNNDLLKEFKQKYKRGKVLVGSRRTKHAGRRFAIAAIFRLRGYAVETTMDGEIKVFVKRNKRPMVEYVMRFPIDNLPNTDK